MKTFRIPLAIAVFAAPLVPAAAQTAFTVQSVTDADRLAEQMRVLAAVPTDLNALIAAGELTLKMGDTTAARNLFVRAERVSARDARVKAGMGKVMVEMERPGEALRLFAEAESLGLAPTASTNPYAAERGLAYDLVGQQQRAQRDYRAALKLASDDETTRRLALSLGISGQRDAAFVLLDPLLRKSDRGAWRSRAFILAMSGDVAAADKIAVNMMPPGTAQGLAPFFQRLPTLTAVDRAFAVHFGEVRPTTDRLADARLVPSLVPLPPEPVQVAAAAPARAEKSVKPAKPAKKSKRGAVQVAVVAPPTLPEPEPPRYVAQTIQSVPSPYVQPRPIVRAPTVVMAATPIIVPKPLPGRAVSTIPAESTTKVVIEPSRPAISAPVTPMRAISGAPIQMAAASPPAPMIPARVVPAPTAAAPVVSTPVVPALAPRPIPAPVDRAATVPAPVVLAPVVSAPAPVAATPAPPPTEVAARASAAPVQMTRSEDSILAAIVANIGVPGSELEVAPPVRPKQAEAAVVETVAEPVPPVAKSVPEKKPPVIDDLAVKKKAALEEATAKKKAIADKKALAAKKAAAEELAEEKKAAAAQKAIEKADPIRIWVQVAGGATESDLAKAWKQVSAKAPESFRGHGGWTTPLRATNRVLTGPFKTDAEARTFVNKLAKEGVSAFTFTSTAGQKIARLAK